MKRVLLACALVCLPLVTARAAEVPIPPPPARWATDTAEFMSPQALQAVDRILENFERATGTQVLVWIGDTTGDAVLEDWTVRAFARWKVGRKGLDNGLILFVFADDRSARIEVGYGLEDEVPDASASRILNEVILPRIGAGDRDGAVQAGVNALMAAISRGTGGIPAVGTPTERSEDPSRTGSRARPMSYPQMVLVGLLVLGFLVLLVTNPGLALYLLFIILSGGRGGGRGGGGFSGGGGSSGGGGASGRW
ncbi:MAG: TPM domain-containing protein [Vicinamibacterales bacterium]